jgi:transposase
MTRIIDRRKAIRLRKEGMTYGDIRRELRVAKSTLSDWLKDYPLNNNQLTLLKRTKNRNRALAIEKTIDTKLRKKEARLSSVYNIEKQRFIFLNKRELEIAGLFLYWGEGNKRLNGPISLNNTDPQVLIFTLFWLTSGLGIPKNKIRVYLHLYKDMDQKEEIFFWSKKLGLPLYQFANPYIKESRRIDIDHKGFGHGTCSLVVSDVRLKEKIMMRLQAIADNYSRKV